MAHEIKARFLATLAAIPTYWGQSIDALRRGGGDRVLTWPLTALAFAVGFLAIGWVPAWLYSRWTENQFQVNFDPVPTTDVAKISFLYLRALSELAEVVIQVGLAFLIALTFEFEPWGYRFTVYLVLFGWLTYRICNLFFANLFAVGEPRRRLLPLSDLQACSMYRGASIVFVPMIIVMIGCVWQETLGMDENAHLLTLIIATAISAMLLAYFVVRHREPVAAMIRGDQDAELAFARRLLASSWHLIALIYIAVAYAVLFSRLVLGLPNAMFLAVVPLLTVFGGIAVYGAGLWLIEWLFQPRASIKPVVDEPNVDLDDSRNQQDADVLPAAETTAADVPPDNLPTYKGLLVRSAQLLAVLAACFWMLNAWGGCRSSHRTRRRRRSGKCFCFHFLLTSPGVRSRLRLTERSPRKAAMLNWCRVKKAAAPVRGSSLCCHSFETSC